MHQSEGKVVHGVPEFGKFELICYVRLNSGFKNNHGVSDIVGDIRKRICKLHNELTSLPSLVLIQCGYLADRSWFLYSQRAVDGE